jgi:hypothetical protein
MTLRAREIATALGRKCPPYARAKADFARAALILDETGMKRALHRMKELSEAYGLGEKAALKERVTSL